MLLCIFINFLDILRKIFNHFFLNKIFNIFKLPREINGSDIFDLIILIKIESKRKRKEFCDYIESWDCGS